MARKRSTRRSSSTTTRATTRRKGERELRAERLTWALLVIVFAVIELLPEGTGAPNWLIPLAGALILLGSGTYQYVRRWHVSPITWIAGVVMLMFTFYTLRIDPNESFLGESLIVFAIVIVFGLITGET